MKKQFYITPETEEFIISVDTGFMLTSNDYDTNALDALTGVDFGDIW